MRSCVAYQGRGVQAHPHGAVGASPRRDGIAAPTRRRNSRRVARAARPGLLNERRRGRVRGPDQVVAAVEPHAGGSRRAGPRRKTVPLAKPAPSRCTGRAAGPRTAWARRDTRATLLRGSSTIPAIRWRGPGCDSPKNKSVQPQISRNIRHGVRITSSARRTVTAPAARSQEYRKKSSRPILSKSHETVQRSLLDVE